MALDFVAGCFGGTENSPVPRRRQKAEPSTLNPKLRTGCAGILVGHPLDTVKIRIQTQDFRSPQYKGMIDCFRNIISGLYKGMSSPLAGVALINAVVFGIYGNLQKNFSEPNSLKCHFLSGAVAGLVQSFICSPMELVKTRMQVQRERPSVGPIDCLTKIYSSEGLRGVFKGLNVTFLREGLGFGVYFSSYEWLTRTENPEAVPTVRLLAAGGSSGAASWLCTYSFDVIKSRLQADGASGDKRYKNSVDCLVKSISSEGIKFLFRGLTPTLVRAFPTNAATWAVVTWIMRAMETKSSPSHNKGKVIDNQSLDHFSSAFAPSHQFAFISSAYPKYFTDEST